MSKKNLEDELKYTKDALQCGIEFSSMRKLDVDVLLEGPKQQMKIETEIDDTRFTSLMDAYKVM